MKRLELNNFILTDGEHTLNSTVPGDISADLLAAGIIPDPFFSDNFKSLGWIHERDWTYTAEFSGEGLDGEITELILEEVDVFSEVYLNGELLGSTDNAFKKFTFDISGKINGEKNVLQIKMLSTYREIEGIEDPGVSGLFNEKRFKVRKMQCSFGWDWGPNFIGFGLNGWVIIESKNKPFLRDIGVECDICGDVAFTVFVEADREYTLKINTDGTVTEHSFCGGEAKIMRRVEAPLLWYPNGYGDPNLYAYSVELFVDGVRTDKKSGVFGFRKIETVQKEKGDGRVSFGFKVNGKEIFAKGSNFVPVTTLSGTASEDEYALLLSAAKQAGYNMIRVWGGGIYEKEIFYSLCDRLGIIVWQDFMLSCSEVSAGEAFRRQIMEEAVYQTKRLNTHPSVCIWCGGNEMWCGGEEKERLLKRDLLEICEKYAPSCIYLYNSPFSIEGDIWDKSTGDNHVSCFEQALEEDNVKGFRDYIYKNRSNFYTECTILGSCRIRSLKRFLPSDKLWPTNELWDEHFVTNPYGRNPQETFVIKEKRLGEALYGDVSSIESFVKKSQLAQADFLRAEVDFARGNGGEVTGHLNWMYNDIWGCGTWSLIDKYFERKPAYFAQKRAFSPFVLNLSREEEGYFANIVNDTDEPFSGELKAEAKTFDGTVVKVFTKSVEVLSRVVLKVLLPDGMRGADYLLLKAGEHKAIYLPDDQSTLTFESDLTVKRERVNENCIRVKIKANSFARCVFVDIPGIVADITDNYFDMEKGDERNITVSSLSELSRSDVSVMTYADVWED
ncbi:MAG: hypothetical protein IJV67_02080 [Clostridia bacterium]|nr:hypothetical protein [Clostridia bacterium]